MKYCVFFRKGISIALIMSFLICISACDSDKSTDAVSNSTKDLNQYSEATTAKIQVDNDSSYIKPIFKVEVEKDIIYKQVKNNNNQEEKLLLDIYQPKGDTATKRPVIIWTHGGGFFSGSKETGIERILAEEFAKRGYVSISINYRLRENPSNDWPGTVKDATDDAVYAINWAVANSKKYKLDTEHIAIGGHSAGGSLAINLCYNRNNDKEKWDKKRIFCVIDMAGGRPMMPEIHKTDPACIIINGTKDNLAPYFQSESFSKLLENGGVKQVLYPVKDAGHDLYDYSDEVIDVITKNMYKALTGKTVNMKIRSSFDLLYEKEYRAKQINLKIDGKLDEWGNSNIISLDQLKEAGTKIPSKEDFEGTAMVGWNQNDPKRIYIAAVITDDIFQDIHPANDKFWEDDSLEVYFDFSKKDQNALIPLMPFIMGANGVDLSCFNTKENTDLAIVKAGNKYYYEIAINVANAGKDAPDASKNFVAKAFEYIGLSVAYRSEAANSSQNSVVRIQNLK